MAAVVPVLQGFAIASQCCLAAQWTVLPEAAICLSVPPPGPLEVNRVRKLKTDFDWK